MESQLAKQLASILQWRRGRGRCVHNPLQRRIPMPIKYCVRTSHTFLLGHQGMCCLLPWVNIAVQRSLRLVMGRSLVLAV